MGFLAQRIMKLCVKYRLNSTPEQEEYLHKLAFNANKLYNADNWMRREQWDKTGKISSWYDQKKTLKYNHWYRLLPSQTAQAIQHYFNKEIAKVQSKTMKQHNKKGCHSITRMYRKRRMQVNQIIHTAMKEVIKHAEGRKIGTIVVGDIKNIRKGKNRGKKGNQKLHSWGFAKLLTQIEYKAKLSGIQFVKVSERDTSKTCSVWWVGQEIEQKAQGSLSVQMR